jgi:LuxR family maltose regulon positive regulatory protein
LNEISERPDDLVLVLDDYHLIETVQIHEDLSYLLDHQPANLRIVLISRVDPPISLARLRAHGQLIEIRATNLEFSAAEAAILFNDVINLNLNPEQVEALNERTEGWIVGLQLAALSLRGHPAYDTFFERFTGSHQFVLDYLTEEVLRTLPDAQRQFLLRTSILDQFCAPLCHAVTGNADCPRMLDEIRIANLFLIPLGRTPSDDTGGRWFRYHHLFAGLLRTLLERDHPGASAALHQRAAVWFDEQGFPAQAVDHALRSGDPGQAKELFFRHWLSVFHSGGVATVLRWLDALPEPAAGVDPSLAVAHCWALFLSGQSTAIGPPLERACEAYDRLVAKGALSGVPQSLIAAHLAMMRSVLARGRADHARSVAYGEEAVRLAPPEMQETTGTGWDMLGLFSTSRHKASMVLDAAGTAWNMLGGARAGAGDYEGAIEAHKRGIELVYGAGNLVGAHMSTYAQAMYLIVQGRLGEAEHACRSMIERGLRDGYGDLPAAGWPHVAMARIELERDRLEEAEAYLDDGLRIARPGGQGELLRAGRYLGAQLAAARGDLVLLQTSFSELW